MPTGLFPNLDDWRPNEFLNRLQAAGYTHDLLQKSPTPLRVPHTPAARKAALALVAGADTPFEIAARLFHLGDTVPLHQAMDLLGWTIKDLMAIGLVHSADGTVRATVQITPHDNEWIISDFPHAQSIREQDWVMGVGPSTRQLLNLIPPMESAHVLEAGCGVAWIARQQVRRGATAVATDINPRALALARLNDRLNNVQGITYAEGDFFEAAAAQAPFDVIVANPPYILSPGGHRTYCETPDGQTLCESVVSRASDYLKPGGYAIVLLNWSHQTDEDWAEEPLRWVGDTAVQCWLHQTECSGPEQYAWQWVHADPRFSDAEQVAQEYHRWLIFYREQEIRRISLGCCFLRKPLAGEPHWRRCDARQIRTFGPLSGHDVDNVMRNETWLQQRQPNVDMLLDSVFKPAAELSATLQMKLSDAWHRQVMSLHSSGQFSYSGQIDETTLRLLELAAQGQTARQLVTALQSGPQPKATIPEEIATLVRGLLAYGLLCPVDSTNSE